MWFKAVQRYSAERESSESSDSIKVGKEGRLTEEELRMSLFIDERMSIFGLIANLVDAIGDSLRKLSLDNIKEVGKLGKPNLFEKSFGGSSEFMRAFKDVSIAKRTLEVLSKQSLEMEKVLVAIQSSLSEFRAVLKKLSIDFLGAIEEGSQEVTSFVSSLLDWRREKKGPRGKEISKIIPDSCISDLVNELSSDGSFFRQFNNVKESLGDAITEFAAALESADTVYAQLAEHARVWNETMAALKSAMYGMSVIDIMGEVSQFVQTSRSVLSKTEVLTLSRLPYTWTCFKQLAHVFKTQESSLQGTFETMRSKVRKPLAKMTTHLSEHIQASVQQAAETAAAAPPGDGLGPVNPPRIDPRVTTLSEAVFSMNEKFRFGDEASSPGDDGNAKEAESAPGLKSSLPERIQAVGLATRHKIVRAGEEVSRLFLPPKLVVTVDHGGHPSETQNSGARTDANIASIATRIVQEVRQALYLPEPASRKGVKGFLKGGGAGSGATAAQVESAAGAEDDDAFDDDIDEDDDADDDDLTPQEKEDRRKRKLRKEERQKNKYVVKCQAVLRGPFHAIMALALEVLWILAQLFVMGIPAFILFSGGLILRLNTLADLRSCDYYILPLRVLNAACFIYFLLGTIELIFHISVVHPRFRRIRLLFQSLFYAIATIMILAMFFFVSIVVSWMVMGLVIRPQETIAYVAGITSISG